MPIGGGNEITVANLSQIVLDVLGCQAPIEIGAEPPRPTEIWRNYTDNVEATLLLNWKPRVTLIEGLRRTLGVHHPEYAPATFAGLRAAATAAAGD